MPGIDRQVPVFVYPARRNLAKIEAELKTLQQVYGLSDLYLYRSETEISAICLRTFPLPRLEKILRASTAMNTGAVLKYKQLFFRIGEKKTSDGRVLTSAPVYEKTIPAPDENNRHYVSRPHALFFADFISLTPYPRMHGHGEVILAHTVIEDE